MAPVVNTQTFYTDFDFKLFEQKYAHAEQQCACCLFLWKLDMVEEG